MAHNDSEEEFKIPLNDLFSGLKRGRNYILFGGIAAACLFAGYALTRPLKYKAEGVFKEKSSQAAPFQKDSLAGLLAGGLSLQGPNSVKGVMSSRKILGEVVKSLHLQGELREAGYSNGVFSRIINNCIVEYRYLINYEGPFIPEKHSPLKVQDVYYPGEYPIDLSIEVDSETTYLVLNDHGELIGSGRLGAPFETKAYTFTIDYSSVASQSAALKGTSYIFRLKPLYNVVSDLSKYMKIVSDKEDYALVKITYCDEDRHLSSRVINQLMLAYQDYLRREKGRIHSEQIAYLNFREEEIGRRLASMIEAFATQISSELSTIGYADSSRAMEFFAQQLHRQRERVLAVELMLLRLEEVLAAGPGAQIDLYMESESHHALIDLIAEQMFKLRQTEDSLQLALNSEPVEKIELPSGGTIALKRPEGSFDPLGEVKREEFQGVNLETANTLLLSYIEQQSELEIQILQYVFLIKELENPEFEISSLSSLIADSVTRNLIEQAGALVLALQDENNRSAKEKERMKAELQTKRKFIDLHLQQTLEVLQLQHHLVNRKIANLQQEYLKLVRKESSILEKQLADSLITHFHNLNEERKLLIQKETDLRKEMSHLPSKWAKEKLIEHQLKLHAAMVEEVAKLVESKNISSNLDMVQSAPLDEAFAPPRPEKQHVLLFGILGGGLGVLLTASYCLVRTVYRA